jgi:hypothetical protein
VKFKYKDVNNNIITINSQHIIQHSFNTYKTAAKQKTNIKKLEKI